MIEIKKPQDPPDILLSRGKAKRTALCTQYTLHSIEYDLGKRKFTFDSEIYGHPSVKDTLILAQHGKCCFCESKIVKDGDVEHFRPKAGCRQSPGQPMIKPGYYWLAYEWDNLLWSCTICNQRLKRNFFPLVDPSVRAKSHKDDNKIKKEEPLLINPAELDPAQYIGFRKEIPYALNDNPFGKETIKVLGLGRESQNENRRSLLKHLTRIHQALIVLRQRIDRSEEEEQIINEIESHLRQAVDDSEAYSAMVRYAVESNFYI